MSPQKTFFHALNRRGSISLSLNIFLQTPTFLSAIRYHDHTHWTHLQMVVTPIKHVPKINHASLYGRVDLSDSRVGLVTSSELKRVS